MLTQCHHPGSQFNYFHSYALHWEWEYQIASQLGCKRPLNSLLISSQQLTNLQHRGLVWQGQEDLPPHCTRLGLLWHAGGPPNRGRARPEGHLGSARAPVPQAVGGAQQAWPASFCGGRERQAGHSQYHQGKRRQLSLLLRSNVQADEVANISKGCAHILSSIPVITLCMSICSNCDQKHGHRLSLSALYNEGTLHCTASYTGIPPPLSKSALC